jgi:hypothetical protein
MQERSADWDANTEGFREVLQLRALERRCSSWRSLLLRRCQPFSHRRPNFVNTAHDARHCSPFCLMSMLMVSRTTILFLAATWALACTPIPRSQNAASATTAPATSTFIPRIVRQRSVWSMTTVELADGTRRAIVSSDEQVFISNPATEQVHYVERIAGLGLNVALDPSLRYLCVTLESKDGESRVGAYDLHNRTLLWSAPSPTTGNAPFATERECLFSGGVITRFDILTGKQSAQNVMPSLKNNSLHARRILWSADRSRFYNLQLLEFNSEAPIGWVVDQRDARTLESMGTFVANCVDVGLRGDRIGLHPLENPRRQQALAQTIRAAFIECQPLPTSTLTELKALEASSKADSPLSWMQLPDSRLVHHRSDGLFIWDWQHHRPVQQLSTEPVPSHQNAKGAQTPIDPVVHSDGAWVGLIRADGTLARWNASSGAAMPPVKLPSGTPSSAFQDAKWQVFAGHDDRLAVFRDDGGQRALFVGNTKGAWIKSNARVYKDITQYIEDLNGRWILSEPHYGIQQIDAKTGRVTARFAYTDTTSNRVSRAVPSADGKQLLVFVNEWSSDKKAGIYVLDARKLAVVKQLPLPKSASSVPSEFVWDATGILQSMRSGPKEFEFMWIDLASGETRTMDPESARQKWGRMRNSSTPLWRSERDDLLLGAHLNTEDAIAGITSGGGWIEYADGRVWCDGAACEHFRCAADAMTLAPIDHPACAAIRVVNP